MNPYKIYSIRTRPEDVEALLNEYKVFNIDNIHSIVPLSSFLVLLTFIGIKPEEENDERSRILHESGSFISIFLTRPSDSDRFPDSLHEGRD